MKKFYQWLLLGVAFLAVLGFTSKVYGQDSLLDKDTVVIGFDDTFAPFGFKDKEGKYVGFDIDLAESIFKDMDKDFEFQPIDWTLKETELKVGNIDMIWNGYSITEERKEMVAFSTPYLVNRQIILVKEDSPIQSKKDLAGLTIVTQEQSASQEAILADQDFMKLLANDLVTYPSFVEVFSDLDNGRADAVVVDETMALYFLNQQEGDPQYRILEENFGEEEYAVGFRKEDQEFVDAFNKILQEKLEDGSLDKIQEKWFGKIYN